MLYSPPENFGVLLTSIGYLGGSWVMKWGAWFIILGDYGGFRMILYDLPLN
jgi:hypothetical protein